MLNMAANLHDDVVCFYPKCGIGLAGSGLWSTSVRSATTCINLSDGDSLRSCFCYGKSYIVSEAHSEAVLGIYDLIQK